ncbi:hypothetical protein EBR66_05425 [bacterium]|nr:hypothetical protein [bacterium]
MTSPVESEEENIVPLRINIPAAHSYTPTEPIYRVQNNTHFGTIVFIIIQAFLIVAFIKICVNSPFYTEELLTAFCILTLFCCAYMLHA